MNRNHNPKKSLGQNFLIDENIIKNIIKSGNFKHNDIVVEIGAGKGALTKELYYNVKKLIIIEKDRELFNELLQQFKNAIIFNEDFLKWEIPENIDKKTKVKVIGNLPYNVASQIIFKVLENILFTLLEFSWFKKRLEIELLLKMEIKIILC